MGEAESPELEVGEHMSTYDYVIVGAGSAGCVLAERLTEDPDITVALIEAGGPDTDQEIHIPAAFSQQFKTRLDWDFDTDPEPGLAGRRAYLPRGKMLGGSSSMNAMIYIRGTPPTTTPGPPSTARRAGRGRTCCPISSRPRTMSAAPMTSTAPAAR